MKKVIIRRIAPDEKTIMYFKTRLAKGILHYVFTKAEATRLTRAEARKIISEMKHQEKYRIVEV